MMSDEQITTVLSELGDIKAMLAASMEERKGLRRDVTGISEALAQHVSWEMEERRRQENAANDVHKDLYSRVRALEDAKLRAESAAGVLGWIVRHWPAIGAMIIAAGMWLTGHAK